MENLTIKINRNAEEQESKRLTIDVPGANYRLVVESQHGEVVITKEDMEGLGDDAINITPVTSNQI